MISASLVISPVVNVSAAVKDNVTGLSLENAKDKLLIEDIDKSLNAGESFTIPAGYHSGKGIIKANSLSSQTAGTADKDKILNGYTAWVNGTKVTGTIPTKTNTDLSASGATVTVPAGYYASQVTKSVATATQATPSISVGTDGKITASATQTAGYVSAGTKSAIKQLTTKAATTYTPGTTDQTIAASTYLTGKQTIKGDSNLVAENIISGKSIFGIKGNLIPLPTAIALI